MSPTDALLAQFPVIVRQPVRHVEAFLPRLDEPGRAQDLQVLGGVGDGLTRLRRQCLDPTRALREQIDQFQPARIPDEERRRCKRLQQPVILAADEVERAAVQPRDQQGALNRERPVHILGRQAAGACADRQTRPARILSLDGQDAPCHLDGIERRSPGEELGGEPLGDHPQASASNSYERMRASCS